MLTLIMTHYKEDAAASLTAINWCILLPGRQAVQAVFYLLNRLTDYDKKKKRINIGG